MTKSRASSSQRPSPLGAEPNVAPEGDNAPSPSLPSWIPGGERASEVPLTRVGRWKAVAMIVLGGGGIASGLLMPETTVEVLLGGALLLCGFRALIR